MKQTLMDMCEIPWSFQFRPLNFDEQQNTEIVLMGMSRGIFKEARMLRVTPRLPLVALSEQIKHVKDRPPGCGRGRGRNWQQQKEMLDRTVGKHHDHNIEVSSGKLDAQGLPLNTTLPVPNHMWPRTDDDLTNIGSIDETGCLMMQKKSIADPSSSEECNEHKQKEELKDVDTSANDSCKDDNSDCYLDAVSDESFLKEKLTVNLIIEDVSSNTSYITKHNNRNKQLDFAKLHETMMKELAMLELPKKTKNVVTLSKSNLEKYHQMFDVDYDSYRQDSSNYLHSNDDSMPLYEKYAVTLDDIRATTRYRVPRKVRENIFGLQISVNNDIVNPTEHFDNTANGHDDQYSGSIDRFSSRFDNNSADIGDNTNIKHVESVFEKNVCMEVSVSATKQDEEIATELLDALDENCSVKLFGLLDSLSDQSSYVIHDVSNSENNRFNETLAQSSCEHEIEFETITKNECDSNSFEHFSTVIVEDDCNLRDRVTHEELEAILKDKANGKRFCKSRSGRECSDMLHANDLDEIDLYDTKHAAVAIEETVVSDGEEYIKVVSKRNKRRLMTPTKDVKMFERTAKDPFWRVLGQNVIQIDGLPPNFEDIQLHNILCGFGSVLDKQVKHMDGHMSVRYRLNTVDACVFAVQCLHDTVCLFSDGDKSLTCFMLEE